MAGDEGTIRIEERKAVVYCRVSTKEQGLEGYSLGFQEQGCMAYCESAGLDVLGVYRDMSSGTKRERPGLDEALALAAREKAEIVCWDLDRLGRSVAHLMSIRESGLAVHIARKGGVLGTMEWGLYSSLAQEEQERLARRVRAGLAQKRKEEPDWRGGGVRRKGEGKRGCRCGDGMGMENYRLGAEASALKRKERARMGSVEPANVAKVLLERGESMRQIARSLNAMRIPAPQGGEWQAVQVSRLLKLHGVKGKSGEGEGVGETAGA